MPWWGNNLYKPENLQKRAYISTPGIWYPTWKELLQLRRRKPLMLFVWETILIVFLLVMALLFADMALVIKHAHESQWVLPALAALGILILGYSTAHTVSCLFYYLFIDRRNIK